MLGDRAGARTRAGYLSTDPRTRAAPNTGLVSGASPNRSRHRRTSPDVGVDGVNTADTVSSQPSQPSQPSQRQNGVGGGSVGVITTGTVPFHPSQEGVGGGGVGVKGAMRCSAPTAAERCTPPDGNVFATNASAEFNLFVSRQVGGRPLVLCPVLWAPTLQPLCVAPGWWSSFGAVPCVVAPLPCSSVRACEHRERADIAGGFSAHPTERLRTPNHATKACVHIGVKCGRGTSPYVCQHTTTTTVQRQLHRRQHNNHHHHHHHHQSMRDNNHSTTTTTSTTSRQQPQCNDNYIDDSTTTTTVQRQLHRRQHDNNQHRHQSMRLRRFFFRRRG